MAKEVIQNLLQEKVIVLLREEGVVLEVSEATTKNGLAMYQDWCEGQVDVLKKDVEDFLEWA